MNRRAVQLSALLLTTTMLAACGPTKTGMEAREAARERLDIVNAQMTYDQAKASFDAGRFDAALDSLSEAIARYDKNAEYHVLLGRIFLETNRLGPAKDAFALAAELNPSLATPVYFQAIIAQRRSQPEIAHELYMKASDIDPQNVQYVLAAAECLIDLDRQDEAGEMIEMALDHFEHNAAMHHLLGQIALFQGDMEKAVSEYSEARMLSPDDVQLLEELARVQYQAGMYGQCLDSITQVQLKSEEERPDILLLEARCLALVQRNPEARNIYLRLSQMRPNDLDTWIEFGTVAWELGDYRRVAECSSRVMSLGPDRFEGFMLRAINERHKGNLPEAVTMFREATARAGESAMPHIMLGLALEESGDAHGAMVAYLEATSADPANAEAEYLIERLNQQITAVPTDR